MQLRIRKAEAHWQNPHAHSRLDRLGALPKHRRWERVAQHLLHGASSRIAPCVHHEEIHKAITRLCDHDRISKPDSYPSESHKFSPCYQAWHN